MTTVMHLIDTGGPGGAETVFLDVVTGLTKKWKSIAVVPSDDWLARALRDRDVMPVVLPSKGAFDIRYLSRLWKLARSTGASVVQTHLLTTAVYGGVIGRLNDIPVISTFHGTVDVAQNERFRRAKMALLRRTIAKFVFVSKSLQKHFVVTHGIQMPNAVVPNGVDTSVFHPGKADDVRAQLGLEPHHILVAAVGNIRAPKNYPMFLRAAALVKERNAACRFVIAGEGASVQLSELREMSRDLKVDDVIQFLGFRSDTDALLRAAQIYALCSHSEGFSLSTVQAMATAVPVIATSCGGPEEILADGGGLLVPPDNPNFLAEAIADLAADPERRARLGRIGRAIAEQRYSVEVMCRRYELIYEEAIRASGSVQKRSPAPQTGAEGDE